MEDAERLEDSEEEGEGDLGYWDVQEESSSRDRHDYIANGSSDSSEHLVDTLCPGAKRKDEAR